MLHGKEDIPQNTIKKIRNILDDLKIEVQENWHNSTIENVYSLSLQIVDTDISVNGKGIGREYALASAYGELIERLFNGYLLGYSVWKYKMVGEKWVDFNEVKLTVDELSKNRFMQYMLTRLQLEYAKKESILELQKANKILFGFTNCFLGIPFESFFEKKKVYLPYTLYAPIYGSNGMSAGNTYEEAMVQSISEIFERYVQRKVIENKIVLPDIPESVWMKFENVSSIMWQISKIPDYEIKIKDASLGGKYPVVALIIIKKNSSNYGIKFGAHPILEIALERAFTEVLQGGSIEDYSMRSHLSFTKRRSEKELQNNLANGYRTGFCEYPCEIFGNQPTYKYAEFIGAHTGTTNKKMLLDLLDILKREGAHVYIRSKFYKEMYIVHTIIPTISEINSIDLLRFSMWQKRFLFMKVLQNPIMINARNVKEGIAVMLYFSKVYPDCLLSHHAGHIYSHKWPGEKMGVGWVYFCSLGYYFLDNYESASMMMKRVYEIAVETGDSKRTFYEVMYRYLDGLKNNRKLNEIRELLMSFYNSDTCESAYSILCEKEKIFLKQYSMEREIQEKKIGIVKKIARIAVLGISNEKI